MGELVVVAATVLLPLVLLAQEVPQREIFGGYSYLRNSGNSFNGWEGLGTLNFTRYLGVTADVSGHYRTAAAFSPVAGFSISSNQRLYNFLFGPTVTARDRAFDPVRDFLGRVHFAIGCRFVIARTNSSPYVRPAASSGSTSSNMAIYKSVIAFRLGRPPGFGLGQPAFHRWLLR